jgi:hypothetical protein
MTRLYHYLASLLIRRAHKLERRKVRYHSTELVYRGRSIFEQ